MLNNGSTVTGDVVTGGYNTSNGRAIDVSSNAGIGGTAKAKSTAPPAAGSGDTPTVKTKEDVDMTVRQLNVRDVRDVAPTCVVNP